MFHVEGEEPSERWLLGGEQGSPNRRLLQNDVHEFLEIYCFGGAQVQPLVLSKERG